MSSDLVMATLSSGWQRNSKPAKPLSHRQEMTSGKAPIKATGGRPAARSSGRHTSECLFVVLFPGAAAVERGAQDVAQAGPRIRGAVLGHRLLLLLELARLDRQSDLARRAVERGDLGVDLLAHGEAVGALLGAVARQLGLADEAGHAVAERDLDAAVIDRGHGAGDDIA